VPGVARQSGSGTGCQELADLRRLRAVRHPERAGARALGAFPLHRASAPPPEEGLDRLTLLTCGVMAIDIDVTPRYGGNR